MPDAQDVVRTIAVQMEQIQDNDVDEAFVAPPSRLERSALDNPLTIEPPDFTRELQRLSGGRLSAAQLASVRESATFAVPR